MFIISFVGFTATSEGDLNSYEDWFYQREGNILDVFSSLDNFGFGDIYVDVLETLVGSIFDSHRFYFACLFAVFGYFYANILFELYSLIPKKLGYWAILLVVSVALYYSIRYTLSLRFYTGALFFTWMMLKYVSYKRTKYFLFALLAPIFHIGLFVIVFALPLILLFKERHWLGVTMVFASYIVNQSTVIVFIEKHTKGFENVEVQTRVKSYVSDAGRKYMEEVYALGAQRANWKLTFLGNIRMLVWGVINAGIALAFVFRKRLLINSTVSTMFSVVLATWIVSNLMLNISNGDRFMIIYTFLALAYFLVVSTTANVPFFFRIYLRVLTPLLLLYGVLLLYAANPIFTSNFFLSNFLLEAAYELVLN